LLFKTIIVCFLFFSFLGGTLMATITRGDVGRALYNATHDLILTSWNIGAWLLPRTAKEVQTRRGQYILLTAAVFTLPGDQSAISTQLPSAQPTAHVAQFAPVIPNAITLDSSGSKLVMTERHKGRFAAGALEGRKLGDLYALYLGLSTPLIPKFITVDFDNQLDVLWERKLRRSKGNRVVAETEQSIETAYHVAPDVGRMSIEDYQKSLADEATRLYQTIDWNKVCSVYRLNAERCGVLKVAMSNVGGRSLLAYSETEILPSTEGALNRNFMDFMLRNGGRLYLESLPAVFDPYLSFGTYQFTSKALFDNGKVREGASRVNQALPKNLRIPGSVALLRGRDHVTAAYLFGIHNVALMIRKLSAREFAVFKSTGAKRSMDIAEIIATAHNKPAVAISGAKRWLDNQARAPYLTSLPRVSRLYAQKTFNNFWALSPTKK
jgi:hypothetical protein